MVESKNNITECLQEEAAFCTAVCPFNLDIRDFIEKMQRGSFNAAYKVYRNAVCFPEIVAQLCPEPCRKVCPRGQIDGTIAVKLLEKASITYANNTNPIDYNVPNKNKKIAIIGAGISGLSCALRLSSKKYEVTVFEKSDRIGGHLWDKLPPELFLSEIERQFMYEEYILHLNTEITDLNTLDFDAIYVATGKGGSVFGLDSEEKPGVFKGGSLIGSSSVEAIADGLSMANAIERYIKVGSMSQQIKKNQTNMQLDPTALEYLEPVLPKDGLAFSREEAVEESKRCLRCSCDACLRGCDLMSFYKKYPKRIQDEVAATIHSGTLVGKGTIAKRLIGTCNQCGRCKDVCPKSIDMGDFLLESRRQMHKDGTLPWSYHDFWLRDMEAAMGERAHLALTPAGYSSSSYVFFPGCQLGASDPRYVVESYRYLLTKQPDMALWLSCCGAPAVWSGDTALQEQSFAMLRKDWESIGKPIIVFACPTCKQMFSKYMEDIKGKFLFEFMNQSGIVPKKDMSDKIYSIFDPCSSRHEPELQQAIRELSKQSGVSLQPLPNEGERAQCCSWGGHVSIANPAYAKQVTKKRISQNENPYITYCVNCRDTFISAGKPSLHILDVLFDLNTENRGSPNITERRNNRTKLKQNVLKEFWNQEMKMENMDGKLKLIIGPELKRKLGEELLLEEDILRVVERCEKSGRKIIDSVTGNFSGYAEIGHSTYWVEYRAIEDSFELINAYSHRMKIQLEESWNGRKADSDL